MNPREPRPFSSPEFRSRLTNYEFINRSERIRVSEEDILSYDEDPDLGRGLSVDILVKWTNQTYHDENLRARFTERWDPVSGISRTNAWRHRNQYYDGLIITSDLSMDYLSNDTSQIVVEASQPTGIHRRSDGLTAYACADKLHLAVDGNPKNILRTIGHPSFARLHSVEFSQDGNRLLTASSSLDLVYELDLEGNETWAMDIWNETPFNTNTLGQTFSRRSLEKACQNPDIMALKEDESLRGALCVVDDPSAYGGLGLTTNLTPTFINSVAYGNESDILATSFHRGEAWVINREDRVVSVVAVNMLNPHGFHRDSLLDGYMVTDTGNEKVTFMTSDFEEALAINFASLQNRKPGLEKSRWLQYVTRLDKDLYSAVIAPRQRLTLFDPVQRVRRDISFDPEWGVQMVVSR